MPSLLLFLKSCLSSTTPCWINCGQLGLPSSSGRRPVYSISADLTNYFRGNMKILRSKIWLYSGSVNLLRSKKSMNWTCCKIYPQSWWPNYRSRLRRNWWRWERQKLRLLSILKRHLLKESQSSIAWQYSSLRTYILNNLETRQRWSASASGHITVNFEKSSSLFGFGGNFQEVRFIWWRIRDHYTAWEVDWGRTSQ